MTIRKDNKKDRAYTASENVVPGSAVGRFLFSAKGFFLPVALMAVLLAVGSFHPSPPSAAQRITGLENIIKCPVCDNISIAQSDAAIASQLRASVAKWVREGKSNSWIENVVVAKFGSNELLLPQNNLVFVIPSLLIGLAGLLLFFYYRRHTKSYKKLLTEKESK